MSLKQKSPRLYILLMLAAAAVLLGVAAPPVAPADEGRDTGESLTAWYTGDGLGVNITLYLESDNTFHAQWRGCLGHYGSAAGTWSRTDQLFELLPETEDGMLAGFFSRLLLVSTPEGPRLRVLQLSDAGEWVAREAFDFGPYEASAEN